MNTTLSVLTKSAHPRRFAGVLGFGLILLLVPPCIGQTPGSNNGSQLGRRIPQTSRTMDQAQQLDTMIAPTYNDKRLQMINAAQHQSMVADTERLVKLVADLNAQINSSNASALTPDQVRMVAEIEKLAHNVRDKMRMSVRSANMDVSPNAPYIPR